MKQEIALLVVFLLVFLYDTFMPRKALGATSAVATVLFASRCPGRRMHSAECMPHRPCAK